jgi:hypothetical protein
VVSADDKVIIEMHLSSGERYDGPEGRVPLLMGKAYEGDETRELALLNGRYKKMLETIN